MHPYRMLTAILVLCSLSAPARPTAQSARIDEQPSFRSGVELVSVDVAVLDKERRPIQGLRAADLRSALAASREGS
jgi:hypothetical protein